MKVKVISPSFKGQISEIITGVKALESAGFDVELGSEIINSKPRFTSPFERVKERTEELVSALLDESIDCIWCADGGSGAVYTLPGLYDAIDDIAKLRPRPLIGYSDITFIHALLCKYELPCFMGPMVCCYEPGQDKTLFECANYAKFMIQNKSAPIDFSQYVDQIRPCNGFGSGILYGGTFSCLSQVIGTRYSPNFFKSILLTEEHGPVTPGQHEYLLWFQTQRLFLSREISNLSCMIFGDIELNGPYNDEGEVFPSIWDTIDNSFDKFPIFTGFEYGHSNFSRPIPLGVDSKFEVSNSYLNFSTSGSFPRRFL